MTSRCRHPGRETSNEATTGGVAVEGAEDGKSDGLVRGAVDKAFLGEGRGRVRPVGGRRASRRAQPRGRKLSRCSLRELADPDQRGAPWPRRLRHERCPGINWVQTASPNTTQR
jgi:hypothetical protein